MRRLGTMLLLCVASAASCQKVPITDIEAAFTLADVTWFEAEQTLFLFYRVDAQQGLGLASQIEITYRTDDFVLPWTPAAELTNVHTHVPVDCGQASRCGSLSLFVPKIPRQVGIRLRYHKDGQLFLDAPVTYNVIGAGPAYSNRSLLVYGVFDAANTRVQWRARHQFPTLRNQEVEQLGLRRHFVISGRQFGTVDAAPGGDPYGYAFDSSCPAGMTALSPVTVETSDRAVFDPEALPLAASASPSVCATSTVTDALGTFQAVALARKNPETRAAFPSLRSPIRTDTQVQFLMHMCTRTISDEHLAMQEQRLLIDGAVEICLDGWQAPTFSDQLASQLSARVDQVRIQGNDMVLSIVLNHDNTTGALAAKVETALMQLLPAERDKSSPRVSGAFVFDSYAHAIAQAQLRPLALWCPALFSQSDLDQIPNQATSCAVMPDLPELRFGAFRFATLPILPSRAQYLNFISKYSDAQGGTMKELVFLAPERTPISENVPFGSFGEVTFFNDERFNAAPGDAFSYCVPSEGQPAPVMFRPDAQTGPMPLSALPDVHAISPQPSYQLGLFWQFPYLLRLQYEIFVAGAATAYSLTVPFGVGVQTEAYSGSQLWNQTEFALGDELLQCTRFCDEPTFDSAGVYNVSSTFRDTYRQQCYRPLFPAPGDGGFPIDP